VPFPELDPAELHLSDPVQVFDVIIILVLAHWSPAATCSAHTASVLLAPHRRNQARVTAKGRERLGNLPAVHVHTRREQRRLKGKRLTAGEPR